MSSMRISLHKKDGQHSVPSSIKLLRMRKKKKVWVSFLCDPSIFQDIDGRDLYSLLFCQVRTVPTNGPGNED